MEHDCDDEFDVLNKTAQRWQRHVASLSDHDCFVSGVLHVSTFSAFIALTGLVVTLE